MEHCTCLMNVRRSIKWKFLCEWVNYRPLLAAYDTEVFRRSSRTVVGFDVSRTPVPALVIGRDLDLR